MYDDRPASPTRGTTMEIVLGADRYALLVIPPGVWHGFKGMSEPIALLANCATDPFDPEEFERVDPSTTFIPYSW
jgi:dTDP-4-dehydrorhamnose 3,5-epimerase